ncbi:hypothetical protein COO60DRAFT_1537242 [Scenedesmus sp. NREL 46B-D3]|nr:hypothetical protein COO60DRAFT_1537242 [Scenedesmus sp. NREL 46B-D3]
MKHIELSWGELACLAPCVVWACQAFGTGMLLLQQVCCVLAVMLSMHCIAGMHVHGAVWRACLCTYIRHMLCQILVISFWLMSEIWLALAIQLISHLFISKKNMLCMLCDCLEAVLCVTAVPHLLVAGSAQEVCQAQQAVPPAV